MLLLITACGGLGWELSRQWQAPLPEQPPASLDNLKGIAAIPPPPKFNMPRAGTFSAIVQRPLFAANRRPPAEQAIEPQSSKELEITFNGVKISAGERQALFQRKDGKGNLRLQEGDEFQGWILEEIEPERVVFRQGDEKKVLALSFDEPPKQPARRKNRRKKRGTRQQNNTTPEQPKKDDATQQNQAGD
jgi:general secretion pathway protein N